MGDYNEDQNKRRLSYGLFIVSGDLMKSEIKNNSFTDIYFHGIRLPISTNTNVLQYFSENVIEGYLYNNEFVEGLNFKFAKGAKKSVSWK